MAQIINRNLLEEVLMKNEMSQLLEYFEKSRADIWDPSNSEALNHVEEIKKFFDSYINKNNTQFPLGFEGYIDGNIQHKIIEILSIISRKIKEIPLDERFSTMKMVDQDVLIEVMEKTNKLTKISHILEHESNETQYLIKKYMSW